MEFLEFDPGLVGGHCLPVDPYYLTHAASKKNYNAKVTLSGRFVNDYMAKFVINETIKIVKNHKKASKIKILFLGLLINMEFSNSQKILIYKKLKKKYKNTSAYDPFFSEKNHENILNYYDNDYYLFLTKGKILKKFTIN